MAHLTVVKAVEDRLKTGFSACPVFVENEAGSTPDQAGPWALVDFPWCRSNWITEDEFEEEGGFRVMLALPILQGTHQGREWLDQIAALFRGQRFGGVQCFAPQTAASDDTNDRGAYFRLVLTVPYTFIIEG